MLDTLLLARSGPASMNRELTRQMGCPVHGIAWDSGCVTCRTKMIAAAQVGFVALIDEATGHQEERFADSGALRREHAKFLRRGRARKWSDESNSFTRRKKP